VKVLVTGGGGQLARWVQRTAPDSAEISAPSRQELDITDPEAVERAIHELGPRLVVNCAAYTQVDGAEAEKEQAFAVNARGAGNLAISAERAGAKLIHVSTDFVFDGRSSRPYAPDAPTGPINVYGESKLAGEELALAGAPNALILRTAWLYDNQGRNFVTTMLRLMAERDELRIVEDQVGTPTHCRTVASAIWQFAARQSCGIYHVTDAGVASWYDFAVAIRDEAMACSLLDRAPEIVPIRTEDFPTAAKRPPYSVLDKSKTWRELGAARHWRTELADSLHQTVR
jgi:dTDP-4-dehydrorhamnose reductase